MNSDLLKELDDAIEQFSGTVGALKQIDKINGDINSAMNEMHDCEERLLRSSETIEKSAVNVNEQAASFSESNEALRISLGKDISKLSDKVIEYTSSSVKSYDEIRIQISNASLEIRTTINVLGEKIEKITSAIRQLSDVELAAIEESRKKQDSSKKLLIMAVSVSAMSLILIVVGMFV